MNANSQAVVWDVESGKRLRAFDLELDSGAIALSRDGKQLAQRRPADGPRRGEGNGRDGREGPDLPRGSFCGTSPRARRFGSTAAMMRPTRRCSSAPTDDTCSAAGGTCCADRRPRQRRPARTGSHRPADPRRPPAAPPSRPSAASNADQSRRPTGRASPSPPACCACGMRPPASEVLKLRPQGGVTKAVFSPSGQQILTVGIAQTLEVWDVKTQKRLLNLRASAGRVLRRWEAGSGD